MLTRVQARHTPAPRCRGLRPGHGLRVGRRESGSHGAQNLLQDI